MHLLITYGKVVSLLRLLSNISQFLASPSCANKEKLWVFAIVEKINLRAILIKLKALLNDFLMEIETMKL